MAKRVRQMTGFVPARLSIFKLAFSHKSNQATKDYAQTNNERLEYLGDAVLGTIVAEYLFKKYPNGDEGFLTKMRSKIVKRKSLNYIGDQMGLDVLLSEYNRTRLSSSMLGNAVEALVGAVYLEKGYRGTKRFVIQRMLKLYVDMHELETVDDNYKSQLLEYCQKNGMQVNYKLLNKFKQDRRDRFKVAVMVNGEQLSLADDFNKKSAEQLASLRALQKLGLIDKDTPQETGRKSPAKETAKVSRAPKRAKPQRKTRSNTKKPVRDTTQVSDEKIAVAAIAKQQAEKPRRVNTEKAPPKAAKTKAEAPKTKTTKKQLSKAAMPARKQRRNNSRLGRSIWNGIQTASACVTLADSLGYYELAETQKPSKPKAGLNKTANNQKTSTRPLAPKSTSGAKSDKQAHVPSVAKKVAKPVPSRVTKPKSTRKRRPVPLRLLTPIVKDASAVMAIDFGELFTTISPNNKTTKPAQKTSPKKPRRKTSNATRLKIEKEQTIVADWEDTPLGLSAEPLSTPKPKANPKQKKQAGVKEDIVLTEQLDKWEDTLLEITPTSDEASSKLPKMYEKSVAKTPASRRRQQRRNTNRKKKTED